MLNHILQLAGFKKDLKSKLLSQNKPDTVWASSVNGHFNDMLQFTIWSTNDRVTVIYVNFTNQMETSEFIDVTLEFLATLSIVPCFILHDAHNTAPWKQQPLLALPFHHFTVHLMNYLLDSNLVELLPPIDGRLPNPFSKMVYSGKKLSRCLKLTPNLLYALNNNSQPLDSIKSRKGTSRVQAATYDSETFSRDRQQQLIETIISDASSQVSTDLQFVVSIVFDVCRSLLERVNLDTDQRKANALILIPRIKDLLVLLTDAKYQWMMTTKDNIKLKSPIINTVIEITFLYWK